MKKKHLRRQVAALQERIHDLYGVIDPVLDADMSSDQRGEQLHDAILALRRQRGIRITSYTEYWSVPE